MEKKEIFNKSDFSFDLDSIPNEEKVIFKGDNNIEIDIYGGQKIILNFIDFSYELKGILYSFSPFHINLNFIDIGKINKIYIPLFLKEKYLKGLKEKRINDIKKAKKYINTSYNKIMRNN